MTEFDKLEKYLKETGANYERIEKEQYYDVNGEPEKHMYRIIIVYDEKGNRIWDAVSHKLSYGYSKGLLEVMGKPVTRRNEAVEGYLTADDIIARLKNEK